LRCKKRFSASSLHAIVIYITSAGNFNEEEHLGRKRKEHAANNSPSRKRSRQGERPTRGKWLQWVIEVAAWWGRWGAARLGVMVAAA
jgi:hypothetical protein